MAKETEPRASLPEMANQASDQTASDAGHPPQMEINVPCAACDNNNRFRSLLEAGPSVIVCLSPDHRILEFNRAAERLFGLQRTAALGQDYLELFVADIDKQNVASDIQRVLAGQPTHGIENSIRTADGNEQVLRWNVSRVLDADGQVSGVICVGENITRSKHSEQAAIDQQQQLRSLTSELTLTEYRERRRVAAGLHDGVGQALAMAKLKLDRVLGSEMPVDTRKLLQDSQNLLIESIRATRSLTFELSSAVLQEMGLKAALESLIDWFDNENDDTTFLFETDSRTMSLSKECDLMLYDVARELLFNATKYAQASTVRLNIQGEDDRIQITIQDDGVGFDMARLDESFHFEGGFGYFGIRARLAYLGGNLEIESSIGQGTRVVTTAPLVSSSNPTT